MRLEHPDSATALLGLRGMKTLATAEGPMRPAQRAASAIDKEGIAVMALSADQPGQIGNRPLARIAAMRAA